MPKITGIVKGTISVNSSGGLYKLGKPYQLRDKVRVARIYNKHCLDVYPEEPNLAKVGKEAQVSRTFMRKIAKELEDSCLVDPDLKPQEPKSTGVCGFLDIEHELFILGLQAENPARSNVDYCHNLLEAFGLSVSQSSISNSFLKRFDFAGKFKKAVLVPIDKFCVGNKARYFEFMAKGKQIVRP